MTYIVRYFEIGASCGIAFLPALVILEAFSLFPVMSALLESIIESDKKDGKKRLNAHHELDLTTWPVKQPTYPVCSPPLRDIFILYETSLVVFSVNDNIRCQRSQWWKNLVNNVWSNNLFQTKTTAHRYSHISLQKLASVGHLCFGLNSGSFEKTAWLDSLETVIEDRVPSCYCPHWHPLCIGWQEYKWTSPDPSEIRPFIIQNNDILTVFFLPWTS